MSVLNAELMIREIEKKKKKKIRGDTRNEGEYLRPITRKTLSCNVRMCMHMREALTKIEQTFID